MGETSAMKSIESSPVEIFACARLPLACGKVQMLPISGRLVGLYADSADFRHQESTDRKGGVPHEFGIDPEPRLPGIQPVERVRGSQFFGGSRTLLVGLGSDQGANQFFDVPLVGTEISSQVIEEIGMRRRFSLTAQVLQAPG